MRTLGKAIGGKASRIYATGMGPAATYGAEVNGISDAELLRLRRLAGAAMRPKVQGRSLSMLLLLNRDPTWRANCAPFLQYSKEAWRAWTQTGHEGCLSLQRLRYLWERGVTGKNGFSTLISPTGKRRWGRVRGPMGAMLLTLHRLGWRMEDAMTVIDDLGVRRKIYDLPKCMGNAMFPCGSSGT